jgi:hypothetical protein
MLIILINTMLQILHHLIKNSCVNMYHSYQIVGKEIYRCKNALFTFN